ncbi:hypothetical protein SAMN05518849_105245 [Sphingobium sp. AP50]|uniref:hypothetical protein n=1 Tax=Sphingobium sp. AP50 TaxID=1884369 RepID=UPI0008C22B7A|nr:hypothetical protein [Sphingobium sp. AP50]SEJ37176.1 hypothetical protein SAMN05518849_105245 [Sphingobium sp. AP50]
MSEPDIDGAAIMAALARLDQRLNNLEVQMRDCISQVERTHHLAEMVLNEVHARRRQQKPDGAVEGRRWSETGFPIIERNWPIHFSLSGEGADFLAGGWSYPETWGIWGCGDRHALRFALDDYRGGYIELTLTVQGFAAPDAQRPTVDFIANGYFLDSHSLRPDPHGIKLRLPPACIGEGDIALHMKVDAAVSPASTGLNEDERELGVGLLTLDIN